MENLDLIAAALNPETDPVPQTRTTGLTMAEYLSGNQIVALLSGLADPSGLPQA
jgi:hypothetical protein